MRVTRASGQGAGVLTKNRIGNALAVLGAAIGLVLVFTGAGQGGHAAAPPPVGQVVPAPGQVHVPAPAVPPPGDDG